MSDERELNACTLCGFTTDNMSLFAEHVDAHENENNQSANASGSSMMDSGLFSNSPTDYPDEGGIIKQEEEVVNSRGRTKNQYSCPHCNFKTQMSQHYRSHLESHQRYQHMYQCDICHMQFSQKANMHRHRMRHSGVKPYQCRFCLKRFFRKDHMQEHSMTHIKTGVSFECPLCDESFRQHSSLKLHLDEHHAVSQGTPANCKRCNAIFSNTKRLLLHFQTRHEDDSALGLPSEAGTSNQNEPRDEMAPLPTLTKNVSSMAASNFMPMDSGAPGEQSPPSPRMVDYTSLFSHAIDRQNLGSSFHSPQEETGVSDSPSLDSRNSLANEPVLAQPGTSRQCPFCEIVFLDQTLYFLHKGLHAESDPWKCNLCGLSCGNKYTFHTHVISADHS